MKLFYIVFKNVSIFFEEVFEVLNVLFRHCL